MRIENVPGSEGNWFDATEVEQYLRVRGVVIRPGQDYVTTAVDVTLCSYDEVESAMTLSSLGGDGLGMTSINFYNNESNGGGGLSRWTYPYYFKIDLPVSHPLKR